MVSALFIVGINAIAQRNASLAGWMASLPLVTVLSIGWLAVDQRGDAEIAKFLTGALWGLAPTTFLLAVTATLLTRGTSLSVAFAIGLVVWIACIYRSVPPSAAEISQRLVRLIGDPYRSQIPTAQ